MPKFTFHASPGYLISDACQDMAVLLKWGADRLEPSTWYGIVFSEDKLTAHVVLSWDVKNSHLHVPDESPGTVTLFYDAEDKWVSFYRAQQNFGNELPSRLYVIRTDDKRAGYGVRCEFNGVTVEHDGPIAADMDVATKAEELYAQYKAKQDAKSAAYWTPERKAEAALKDAERKSEQSSQKAQTEAARAAFPFVPDDVEGVSYAEHKDAQTGPYSLRIVQYAEDVASLTAAGVADGKSFSDAMRSAESVADYDGISGAMHGMAKSTLLYYWSAQALRLGNTPVPVYAPEDILPDPDHSLKANGGYVPGGLPPPPNKISFVKPARGRGSSELSGRASTV